MLIISQSVFPLSMSKKTNNVFNKIKSFEKQRLQRLQSSFIKIHQKEFKHFNELSKSVFDTDFTIVTEDPVVDQSLDDIQDINNEFFET